MRVWGCGSVGVWEYGGMRVWGVGVWEEGAIAWPCGVAPLSWTGGEPAQLVAPPSNRLILNPNDRVWMPCLESRVDLTEKRGRGTGINGFWSRHVGKTSPRTIATPARMTSLPSAPDIVIWIWYHHSLASGLGALRFHESI